MDEQALIDSFKQLYGRQPTEAELAEMVENQKQQQPVSRVEKHREQEAAEKKAAEQKAAEKKATQVKADPEDEFDEPELKPAPTKKRRRARVSFIGGLLGLASLIGFFILPFLQITLPNSSETSVTLYDLMTNASNVLTSAGAQEQSQYLTIGLYMLIILPIIYIFGEIVPNFFAKGIALLASLLHFGAVIYVAVTVYNEFQNSVFGVLNQHVNLNLTQFFGTGFWATLLMPLLMFSWSVLTIRGKKVK